MTDFLDEKKREIHERLKELRPLVDEFHRLEAAAAALDGVSVPHIGGGGERSRRQSRPTSGGASSGGASRGRPKGSGTRSKQALEAVRGQPGITIPELAQAMGIAQNYLYRVMPELQKDGLVRKEGRGWYAVEAA
ncbi:MAG: Rrf2 family transcriptional regulator [Solirubrobacterales bacterium]|nr:Rrf2 family transcriptional regulator [Solirubrobacterales bacterium]